MSEDPGKRVSGLNIRPVTPDDMELLANLVRELAVYEKLEEYAKATPEDFRRNLFGPRPAAEAAIAEVDGEPIGFALWFTTFSTFRGLPGIYLEDLYVRPQHRGRGIGKALLAMLARLAADRGCGRLEWAVLNWNEPAIGFYCAIGAKLQDEWTVYRLEEEPLRKLSAEGRRLEQAEGMSNG
jgi:GNAT superfamily N-acetyltransferase